ncbi:hypothetical protein [Streptomyces sp. HSG2]|uniref:hypothetical protein n=1 Tax=Streptomyces sp. HSG2 TaxID=2797167 RepID=UPI0019031C68|nr:hypothetical protein [Streptomyces sp. HSG2]
MDNSPDPRQQTLTVLVLVLVGVVAGYAAYGSPQLAGALTAAAAVAALVWMVLTGR